MERFGKPEADRTIRASEMKEYIDKAADIMAHASEEKVGRYTVTQGALVLDDGRAMLQKGSIRQSWVKALERALADVEEAMARKMVAD